MFSFWWLDGGVSGEIFGFFLLFNFPETVFGSKKQRKYILLFVTGEGGLLNVYLNWSFLFTFFGTLVSGSGDLGIGHRLDKLIFWKDREISLRKAPKYQRIKSNNNQEHKQQGMEVMLT